MRWILVLAVLVGCQRVEKAPAADVDPAYRADLENLCDAEARSGAREPGQPNGPADLAVAQWLGKTLVTPESRKFLVTLAKLPPAEKGAAMRAEATRVGLPGCALADTWK